MNRTSHFSLLIVLVALCVCLVHGQTFKVVGVADGDTITVLDEQKKQIKVRLAGIDAPEKNQDFGNRSKQHLSDLVFGKFISLEGNKIDRYGRRVAKVMVGGKDANLEQVKAGLAWHYKQYQREQSLEDRRLYSRAETDARKTRVNIWSMPDPVAPWEYRSRKAY